MFAKKFQGSMAQFISSEEGSVGGAAALMTTGSGILVSLFMATPIEGSLLGEAKPAILAVGAGFAFAGIAGIKDAWSSKASAQNYEARKPTSDEQIIINIKARQKLVR